MRYLPTLIALMTCCFLAAPLCSAEAPATQPAPFPGKKSDWHGYDQYEFTVDGKAVDVVVPKNAAPGKPWLWYGEFFGYKPDPDIMLLGKGFHVAYMHLNDMLGSPEAVKHMAACHKELTEKYGLSKKPAMVGLSRGGLYVFNFAAAYPDNVGCLYLDAAVCDFKSWPGGKPKGLGAGSGSPGDWKLVLERYGFKSDADAIAYKGNPVDNLEPLAKAKIPLLMVFGDADTAVPWEENTKIVSERYEKLGGSATLIRKKGGDHHPHGLVDSTPIVEFVEKNAGK